MTKQQASRWPAIGEPALADPIWTTAHIGLYLGLGETQTRGMINAAGFPPPKRFPVELKCRRWDRDDVITWFKSLPAMESPTDRFLTGDLRFDNLPTRPTRRSRRAT